MCYTHHVVLLLHYHITWCPLVPTAALPHHVVSLCPYCCRYFQCPPRHGLFAPLPKVEKLADSGPPTDEGMLGEGRGGREVREEGEGEGERRVSMRFGTQPVPVQDFIVGIVDPSSIWSSIPSVPVDVPYKGVL